MIGFSRSARLADHSDRLSARPTDPLDAAPWCLGRRGAAAQNRSVGRSVGHGGDVGRPVGHGGWSVDRAVGQSVDRSVGNIETLLEPGTCCPFTRYTNPLPFTRRLPGRRLCPYPLADSFRSRIISGLTTRQIGRSRQFFCAYFAEMSIFDVPSLVRSMVTGRSRFGSVTNGVCARIETAVSSFSGFYYFRCLRFPVLKIHFRKSIFGDFLTRFRLAQKREHFSKIHF